LQATPLIENPENGLTEVSGDIKFDNVSFTYPDTGIKALQGINFDLKAGQKMAIVGKTGSGKTTIADLLLRMYDASDGEIKINNSNIKSFDLAALRSKIGYVPQDVFLFSDSIKANLSFASDIKDQKILEKFAAYASIHEEIKALPDGYDTLVGERGVTLSGGQKQRITIARALLKQPEIMILDDCLSAVDVNTEQSILAYLQNELSDKTTVIITHRIYSLLSFDKILVLDDGKISESGTHEELLEMGGFYAEMYNKQQLEENSNIN
jgi:ATP-binding cassette subfamily B protein